MARVIRTSYRHRIPCQALYVRAVAAGGSRSSWRASSTCLRERPVFLATPAMQSSRSDAMSCPPNNYAVGRVGSAVGPGGIIGPVGLALAQPEPLAQT